MAQRGAPPTPPGWSVALAETPVGRARGLLGRRAMGAEEGLWLPVRSVHTVGMRLALDLVWLGGDGCVVRVDEDVRPGRMRTCLRATGGVVEVRAGRGAALVEALGREPSAGGLEQRSPGGGAYRRLSSSRSSGRLREPR
ncbi:DUF192 domain-containing protein [Patulibacter sp. S7RM1-6]